MMSMGSLAHYMHDLSREGFDIHDFLHEGNGEVWKSAMQYGPARVRAVGGDRGTGRRRRRRLPAIEASSPASSKGFERVAEGGGVALYRATPP